MIRETPSIPSVAPQPAGTGLPVRPYLRPHGAPDGTVTTLFSDIEGFTHAEFLEITRDPSQEEY